MKDEKHCQNQRQISIEFLFEQKILRKYFNYEMETYNWNLSNFIQSILLFDFAAKTYKRKLQCNENEKDSEL